jgi:hypothetical protein
MKFMILAISLMTCLPFSAKADAQADSVLIKGRTFELTKGGLTRFLQRASATQDIELQSVNKNFESFKVSWSYNSDDFSAYSRKVKFSTKVNGTTSDLECTLYIREYPNADGVLTIANGNISLYDCNGQIQNSRDSDEVYKKTKADLEEFTHSLKKPAAQIEPSESGEMGAR